jgi:hypothetical protein
MHVRMSRGRAVNRRHRNVRIFGGIERRNMNDRPPLFSDANLGLMLMRMLTILRIVSDEHNIV